jgi:hypothetical protein
MRKGMILLGVLLVFSFAPIFSSFAFEMTADMVIKQGPKTQNGTTAIKGEKIRVQMKGQSEYTIMRGDKKVNWVVIPQEKSYMEMHFDPAKKPRIEEKVKGEVSRKLIGSETIDGHPTKKYEVTVKDQGRTDKFYQWIATDLDNFPIKTAALDGTWSTEYKNINKSAADTLFEVPSGYEKMAIPAMPNIPGTSSTPGFGGKRK